MRLSLFLLAAGCIPEPPSGPPVDADGDHWVNDEINPRADCDDSNPDVHPFATEYCDGIDNDCDGLIDEDGCE